MEEELRDVPRRSLVATTVGASTFAKTLLQENDSRLFRCFATCPPTASRSEDASVGLNDPWESWLGCWDVDSVPRATGFEDVPLAPALLFKSWSWRFDTVFVGRNRREVVSIAAGTEGTGVGPDKLDRYAGVSLSAAAESSFEGAVALLLLEAWSWRFDTVFVGRNRREVVSMEETIFPCLVAEALRSSCAGTALSFWKPVVETVERNSRESEGIFEAIILVSAAPLVREAGEGLPELSSFLVYVT